jgi:catechol 2,3-dioxygenase-like lactoylglutathione lyase family enzyme
MPKTDRPQPVRAVRDPGLSHIALKVDDLDQAAADLKARGLTFDGDEVSAVGGGRILNFSDPDGNMLQIVERPQT